MFGMCRLHVFRLKCQMELIVAQVVGVLLPVAQPGQLQLVAGRGVAQINKDKASVCRLLAAYLLKSQCFLIKFQRLVQIDNIEIVVCKCKFHRINSSPSL